MPTLCATRFNTETFLEYTRYINNINYEDSQTPINNIVCIYNTPVKIAETIFPDETLYVLEMNNSTNTIEGIGVIKNKCVTNQKHKVYSDRNYNRYSYNGYYRIQRANLNPEEEKIFKILDLLLFKGYRHFKRGHGIQKLPKWILNNADFNFTDFCKTLFKST
jgi:hypothetical protein